MTRSVRTFQKSAALLIFFHANTLFPFHCVQMAALPIDTSLTGYASGSLDGQNDIYRSRQRPQPHPLVHDSGYGSAIKNYSSSIQTIPSRSLISLANSIQCQELLNNDSNFAPYTAVECYESDGRLTSTCKTISETPSGFPGHRRADLDIERRYLDENGFNKCVSVRHSSVSFVAITMLITSVISTSHRWRTQASNLLFVNFALPL